MECYDIYWADGLTNEDLIARLIQNPNDSRVMEELTRRLTPIILGEAQKYRNQLPFDTEDYLQEGRIVLWQIAAKGEFKPGNFRNYFISAIRFHYCHLYRDYVLRNFVCIGGYEDVRGNTYQILIEAPYAQQYRARHREHCRKSYARKKAEQPPKAPRPKMSEEERIEKRRACSLAYYYAHRDEMNQRQKDKRAAARAAKPPRVKQSYEERRERDRAWHRAYYETHKDELNARAREKRRWRRIPTPSDSTPLPDGI